MNKYIMSNANIIEDSGCNTDIIAVMLGEKNDTVNLDTVKAKHPDIEVFERTMVVMGKDAVVKSVTVYYSKATKIGLKKYKDVPDNPDKEAQIFIEITLSLFEYERLIYVPLPRKLFEMTEFIDRFPNYCTDYILDNKEEYMDFISEDLETGDIYLFDKGGWVHDEELIFEHDFQGSLQRIMQSFRLVVEDE